MRILISNDDGIAAEGLVVLEKIARALSDDVWVVAPEIEQSGASHSLTLHLPVRVRKLGAKRFAVNGTPTDCVLLALQEILPKRKGKAPVDLVLSGVNRGSNAGDDVTYSGTVAAAMEGTLLGIPSIALSQFFEEGGKVQWATAEKHAPALIKKLLKAGWPADTLINVNFPDCVASKVREVRVCPQGKRVMRVALTSRMDPKMRPYFWIGGDRDNRAHAPGVDIEQLGKGHITVTPLRLDLTDYKTLEVLRAAMK